MIAARERRERRLLSLFQRRIAVEPLEQLIAALKNDTSPAALERTALALDSSAFLRITKLSRKDDVLDYLSVAHKAPLVIPGQAIQEFWNNKANVSDTLAVNLQKKFENFRKEIEKAEAIKGELLDGVTDALSKVVEAHGEVHDPKLTSDSIAMLEALKPRAIVPYCSRQIFCDTAADRKKSGTPPGFKDDGDGDFYIWADLLYGMLSQRRSRYDKLVLVTLDEKIDWSRNGTPHPVLSAEVKALLNCGFEIWRPDRLQSEVVAALDAVTGSTTVDA